MATYLAQFPFETVFYLTLFITGALVALFYVRRSKLPAPTWDMDCPSCSNYRIRGPVPHGVLVSERASGQRRRRRPALARNSANSAEHDIFRQSSEFLGDLRDVAAPAGPHISPHRFGDNGLRHCPCHRSFNRANSAGHQYGNGISQLRG